MPDPVSDNSPKEDRFCPETSTHDKKIENNLPSPKGSPKKDTEEEKVLEIPEGITGNAPPSPKWVLRDSVFKNLFKDADSLLEMYRTFHPEDTQSLADEIQNIRIECVLTNQLINDLSFTVNGKLILVEAQSSWNQNMPLRFLLYLSQILNQFLKMTGKSLHERKAVRIPQFEFFTIYTGRDASSPKWIGFADAFLKGNARYFDLRTKVFSDGSGGDIISQYIAFVKMYDEQEKKYGRTREAITETIRICKDTNILREYLMKHEMEVIDIMEELFSQEAAVREYAETMKEEGREKGREEGVKEGFSLGISDLTESSILRLHGMGLENDVIAKGLDTTLERVQSVLASHAVMA